MPGDMPGCNRKPSKDSLAPEILSNTKTKRPRRVLCDMSDQIDNRSGKMSEGVTLSSTHVDVSKATHAPATSYPVALHKLVVSCQNIVMCAFVLDQKASSEHWQQLATHFT